ncbi:phenylacetate--CoA ligase family protein [Psychrobacter sp. Marseille-P5312]|uniref:phenylacetate--CoA ligase family protein n=1 Tax=Psychrobacter sp. Marseille-P5312 TaxID=2086574 RepID=UPI000CF5DF31|nr:phenylacetate--CoA ligase family protein [Psychrobacter sp. Marseille-P5312]
MSILFKAFKVAPIQVQNLAITIVSTNLYRVRHGRKYKKYKKYHKKWEQSNASQLKKEVDKRFYEFLKYSRKNSKWFNKALTSDMVDNLDIYSLPILEKSDLINHFNEIITVKKRSSIVNQTSGTTGSSLTTYMTKEDMQERWAIVDAHKEMHGFKFGKKTAWFSGKNLITDRDISKGICSHYDFVNKIRYYSTFHINSKNFDVYWESLNSYQPEFIVGFPSSIFTICEIADSKGLKINKPVKVFFSTSENLTPEYREVISKVLGCRVADHYSASEGAPIIIECIAGSLHLNPLSGIIEVLDSDLLPTTEGELIVTSFTSHGTPLIRYRVGDIIRVAPKDATCTCGSNFPLIDSIEGRSSDYIYSPEKGRINQVNIGNSAKGVSGIICFQIIQNQIDSLKVMIVKNDSFTPDSEKVFLQALQQRVGNKMRIELSYVKDIPRDESGKFRIIKNNLNHDDL